MKLLRYLRPEVNAAVALILAALLVAANLWLVTEVHRVRQERQAACREQTRREIGRKPILAHTVRLADACATLAVIRGER